MKKDFITDELYAIIAELKGLIRHGSMNDEELLKELVGVVADEINIPIIVTGAYGEMLTSFIQPEKNIFDIDIDIDSDNDNGEKLPDDMIELFLASRDEKILEIPGKKEVGVVFPVVVHRENIGYIFAYDTEASIEAMLPLLRICFIYITLLMKNMHTYLKEAEERQKKDIQVALASMSYTELEALRHLFEAIGGTQGLVVARKIADDIGITRSVIVNALRKLESAGAVESRSLGMKGTFVKVVNPFFLEELDKVNL